MTTMTIPAVYENGVFRPKAPVELSPGTDVQLIVQEDIDPVAIMKARFPESFGILDPEAADEMQKIVDEEFGKVNPDEWR